MSITIEQLRTLLASEFEIDPDQIVPEADLFDDLDIDSIDAIDMLSQLRAISGQEISAQALKSVRTVADVLALVD